MGVTVNKAVVDTVNGILSQKASAATAASSMASAAEDELITTRQGGFEKAETTRFPLALDLNGDDNLNGLAGAGELLTLEQAGVSGLGVGFTTVANSHTWRMVA